jgi:putative membrane protein insertion efficiency factor
MNLLLIFLLKTYKRFVSPVFEKLFGNACRFTPSCSEYTIEALEKYGLIKGLEMGINRLGRCHPWGGSGFDPVTK